MVRRLARARILSDNRKSRFARSNAPYILTIKEKSECVLPNSERHSVLANSGVSDLCFDDIDSCCHHIAASSASQNFVGSNEDIFETDYMAAANVSNL